jgi:phage terminase small subunit
MANLTEKQKRFADYFIELGNATEAYKRAGYSYASDNIAGVEGHKLLKNPKVRAYVDENLGQKDKERIASQDEVLEFLTSVMRGKVIERVPLLVGQGMQELVDNVPPVQVREKAAELLGKRYMLWTDNLKLGGTVGVQIVDDIK